MNRAQKRAFINKAHKKGMSREVAKTYVDIVHNGTGTHTPANPIEDGETVILNIEAIKNRKNYERMSIKYKDFVEKSSGVVYTAHVERENLISLKEEPQWLFWSGDLIKASVVGDNNDQ